MKRAVFLDKDGTLIPDIPYNVNPGLITLEQGAEALSKLADAGFRFVIISNQSGIARGYFSEEDMLAVQRKVETLLGEHRISLDGFYYCPHHPEGNVMRYARECDCRKPMPGMIRQAAAELSIDLSRSWMIGDILNDVEAGKKAGCKTILIDNGNETEWMLSDVREPDYKARNLSHAVELILKHGNNADEQQLEKL
jgi:D-glycero-D-manno-heptose 1,7-bisphosphate phosphatase